MLQLFNENMKLFQVLSSAKGQYLLCFMHAVLMVVSIFFAVYKYDDATLPVTLPGRNRMLVDISEEIARPNLYVLIALFSFTTASAHLLYGIFNTKLASIYFRWLEYAISAPIMLVITSMLSGIQDLYTLLCVFALCSTTMSFGQYGDSYFINNFNTYYLNPIWEGFYPYVFAWTPITVQFFRVVSATDGVPNFVKVVYFSQFLLFTSFAFVQLYFVWWKQGNYSSLGENYLRQYDGCMHLLSLVAKGLLTFLVIGGTQNIL